MGFVTSRRGAGGAGVLARAAEDITVLQVVEAFEGSLSLNLCTRDEDYRNRADACTMHLVWLDAENLLRAHPGRQTMAGLAEQGRLTAPMPVRGGGAVR